MTRLTQWYTFLSTYRPVPPSSQRLHQLQLAFAKRLKYDQTIRYQFLFSSPSEDRKRPYRSYSFHYSTKPALHATLFLSQARIFPDMFTYLPFGPFKSDTDFLNLIETRVEPNPGYILFCVWDKTTASAAGVSTAGGQAKDGSFAGIIGLLNSSADALATEIGFVMILPPFHRTHVASNATGLLLHYALEIDLASSMGDESSADIFHLTNGHPLGLRRVFWQTNAHNAASRRLAERMGFQFEATLRWDRVLAAEKPGNGNRVRDNDPKFHCVGRTTDMLSLCWDDWEGGARERVQQAMRRTK